MQLQQNTLFYGDNLSILRDYIDKESIDLIYLDPPFNSKADYNVLFREITGEQSTAQIQAFSDFWHWDSEAKHAYDYLATQAPTDVANLTTALYSFLGRNDMLAYLVMMGERLLQLHRVLKPTGSIFLHCDPTASHYLKLMMDSIFGVKNFRNEIMWKRANAHNDPKKFGNITDILLFYSKNDDYIWNTQYTPYDEKYLESHWKRKDASGHPYRLMPLDAPKHGDGGNLVYEWHGKLPAPTRTWSCVIEKMEEYEEKGLLEYTSARTPCLKKYLDDMPGRPLQNIWTDIPPVNPMASERLGYPTQKPIQLLERIIGSITHEGDWVLDPFCGCGTAIIAAEKMRRHWIGIDITYLAINLIKGRVKDTFPTAIFEVKGEPRDLGAARELAHNRYQFQWWALSLIGARPTGSTTAKPKEGKKGADEGVDGWLRFADGPEGHIEKIVVQVKSGHVGVKDIRELRDVVSRQKGAVGIFITLEEPTDEMIKEVKVTDPYISPRWKAEYPKIQILTIEQLLKGEHPKIPPIVSLFQEALRVQRASNTIETKLQ